MICLDCGNMDIRYDEKEKSYHCNNCGSRNIGTRKEGCKYMLGNGLCGKNPVCTSSGECEAPCSYYEKQQETRNGKAAMYFEKMIGLEQIFQKNGGENI